MYVCVRDREKRDREREREGLLYFYLAHLIKSQQLGEYQRERDRQTDRDKQRDGEREREREDFGCFIVVLGMNALVARLLECRFFSGFT